MIAIVLALGAALGWGTSDFIGGLKSRAVPLLSVLFVSQVTALAILAVIVAVRGAGLPDASALAWAAAAGLAETAAVAALYRGLAVGTISIVAAVAATAPVVPLVVGFAIGEVPGPLQLTGLALAIVGLVVASIQPSGAAALKLLPSLGFGAIAAAGFGFYFSAMDTASAHDVGWALVTARVVSVAAVGLVILAVRHRIQLIRSDVAGLASIGILIVVADAMYATATTLGLVGVVAVVGSLHTVVTMVLARFVLHERLAAVQRIGIGTSLAGVLAISAG